MHARQYSLQALVVASESEERRQLVKLLAMQTVAPVVVDCVAEARAHLRLASADLTFCHEHLPDGGFRDVLALFRDADQGIPVVVCSASDDPATYLAAMEAGAFDFIASPYQEVEIKRILGAATKQQPSPAARGAEA